MKNLIKLTVVAAFGVIALSACKKTYTCTYPNEVGTIEYPDLTTSAQVTAAKTGCETAGGTWKAK